MLTIRINKTNWLKSALLIFGLIQFGPVISQEQSLSLDQAIQKTLESNYGLQIVMADQEISAINNSWGKAGRYPSVGFDMNLSHSTGLSGETTSISNRIVPGVSMRWILFDGFRVNITMEKLDNLEQLSGGQSMVVIENTIEDVILAYYNVLLQLEKLAVYEEVLSLSSDRYENEQYKSELGGSLTYDVLLAKNEFLSEKALYLRQEVNVAVAIRALNYIMGERTDQRWSFITPFDVDSSDYSLAELNAKMISNNQTLKNQYISMSIKNRDLELIRSDLFPSLTLTGGFDYSGLHSIQKPNDPSWTSSLGPSAGLTLSYNIFNGGVRRDAIEIAKISTEIAEIEENELESALTNQLYNTYDYYGVNKALLEVAEEGLEAARLNLSIAEDRYRSGVINQFNYRDIQLIYQNTAIKKLESVYYLIESQTALTRITGGFLSSVQ